MNTIYISSLSKFFKIHKFDALSYKDNKLTLHAKNPIVLEFNTIDTFKQVTGLLWTRFIIKLNDGKSYELGGFKKKESRRFYTDFIKQFANYYYSNQYKKAQSILQLYPASDQYFQMRQFQKLVSEAKEIMKNFAFLSEPEDPKYTKGLVVIQGLLNDDKKVVEEHNRHFLEEELKTYEKFFENVEKNPLTPKQREAVIVNEQANLIIAGAGSGKTSVMIARVGYVMQKYRLTPNEIVIMAFGSDAAKELSERIEERLHLKENMNVSTFHSFGQSIIAQVEGKKPSLATWVEDINSKASLVQEILFELSENDSKFNNVLMQFFAHPFAQYKSEFSFKSKFEYEQYLYENKVVSLKGERVKSYEECEIANFLLLNGINYEYEPFYQHETATEEYRQYQPDFYLTDYDIYLEHFGIDKNNKTAPFVNNEKYLKDMEWKRQLHEQYETTLIETYSYYQQEGRLLHKLEAILKEHEVQFSPKTFQDALKDLPESGFSEFSKTVATFIGHYKSNDHTMQKIRHRAGSDERLNAYLDLFGPTLAAYERKKTSMNVIDFDDMINKAIQYVEKGKYKSEFKCILVDEYQDISAARARLIKAICNQVDDSVLTVVGDDWQSIYRFAGSEISLFHHFEDYFGYAKTVKLDYTFRYNDKISEVSQKFVEKNPNQIKKEIKTLTQVSNPTVHVWWGDDKDIDRVKAILTSLSDQRDVTPSSVFILGRNRYSFPERINTLKQHYSKLDIQLLTAHRSKGLEADICIITGVCSGSLGFPSSIEGDPIHELALAEQENFEYAEERRLFYVALTRAKDEVHILASNSNVSPFAKELEESGYVVEHHYKDNIKPQVCPGCCIGTLVRRTSNGREFWGCSNYGTIGCTYTAKIHNCREKFCNGIMQFNLDKKVYICNNENCKSEEKACPKCNGKLELKFNRRQKNKPFIGCSNFKDKVVDCRYTEPV